MVEGLRYVGKTIQPDGVLGRGEGPVAGEERLLLRAYIKIVFIEDTFIEVEVSGQQRQEKRVETGTLTFMGDGGNRGQSVVVKAHLKGGCVLRSTRCKRVGESEHKKGRPFTRQVPQQQDMQTLTTRQHGPPV